MANLWLNLYDRTGTPLSTGDNSHPLTFTLDASENEVQSDTLTIKCEQGYQTSTNTDTTISITSDTGQHWALSLDGTNWSNTIIIGTTIDTVGTDFYVKASSSSNESPHNDTDTKIEVLTKIAAVS